MKDYSKENLDVTHYRNGDPIPFVKSKRKWSNLTTGAYCYYDNDPEKGVLYNWYAVNDSRGLAPYGWKIPTIEELEQIDLTTGLPGGCRGSIGDYSYIGYLGNWWSSTEGNSDSAWSRFLFNGSGNAGRFDNDKEGGLSVRCLKDEVIINKSENMKVIINGIVYVPKELEKEKKVEPIIVEKNYKFEMHPDKSTNKLRWDDAVAYVKSLGDDWRLPTIEECFIIYNNKLITEDVYWINSEYSSRIDRAFRFYNGTANYNDKLDTYFVRTVRSL